MTGEQLRELREATGLARWQFCWHVLDNLVRPQTVAHWELGHRKIPGLVGEAIVARARWWGKQGQAGFRA